jgi:hypothetical protein
MVSSTKTRTEVPGPHVTSQQKRLFMDFRRHHPQPVAAAKAGFSERTGRRIETAHHLPPPHADKPDRDVEPPILSSGFGMARSARCLRPRPAFGP